MICKWWVLLGVLIVGALSWALWCNMDWVVKGPNGRESGSTTLRNLGLVIGGVIAIGLAIWRSIVADRQAKTAHHQAETAQRQAKIAEGGLRNERYQKSAEMLGSEVLSVRLGGIYALQRLAEEDPEQYHVQIMRLLCAFVRHPVRPGETALKETTLLERTDPLHLTGLLREDVQASMESIGTRSDADIELEKKERFRPDFSGADLRNGRFLTCNLSGTNLVKAIISGTKFGACDLSGIDLTDALISATTRFAWTKGLTQDQLDQAHADPENPPKPGHLFENSSDAETKFPLVWHGKPLEQNE